MLCGQFPFHVLAALLLVHGIFLSFVLSCLAHFFKISLWDIKASLMFKIACQFWGLTDFLLRWIPRNIYNSGHLPCFRAIVLTNKKTDLSLVILEPFNTIAMEVLENQLSTFELNTDFSEYPIEPQGT